MFRRRHRQNARRVDIRQYQQPSAKPPATISCSGWLATWVQMMPSPPASSIGALPIGPPPKNGHSTIASAPLVASHLPLRVNDSVCVFAG